MSNNWIAVASAEHVRIGRVGGFMQVCHGKATPLRRVKPGDRIAYYSPTLKFGSNKNYRFSLLSVLSNRGNPTSSIWGMDFVLSDVMCHGSMLMNRLFGQSWMFWNFQQVIETGDTNFDLVFFRLAIMTSKS
ncbi:Uncharacterised protein [Yersinia massiliensis]|uniref:EVE domain-containing protein n=1 Tax=Yersinia massiliensis TaxID=419257 RepID=UPI0005DBB033|nr:Uncharacterised protein [Yersinia massiliensis]